MPDHIDFTGKNIQQNTFCQQDIPGPATADILLPQEILRPALKGLMLYHGLDC